MSHVEPGNAAPLGDSGRQASPSEGDNRWWKLGTRRARVLASLCAGIVLVSAGVAIAWDSATATVNLPASNYAGAVTSYSAVADAANNDQVITITFTFPAGYDISTATMVMTAGASTFSPTSYDRTGTTLRAVFANDKPMNNLATATASGVRNPSTPGAYPVQVSFVSNKGTATGSRTVPIVAAPDTTAPTAVITAPADNELLSVSPYAITGTADDGAGAGVSLVEVMIARSDGTAFDGSNWVSTPTWLSASGTTSWSYAWALPADDGAYTYTISARATDAASNVGDADVVNGVTVDTAGPTGTVSIDAGASYATATAVTLTLTATDAGSGVADMQFSNDGSTWSGWEPYSATKAWTLTTGDGTKTVYAQLRDAAGNASASAITDTIVLDTVVPSTTLLADPPNGNDGWYATLPTNIQLIPSEGTVFYALNADAFAPYLLPLSVSTEGTHTLSYYAVDAALNTETTKTATFRVDTSKPTTPTLSAGAVSTESVELTWDAVTDAISGVAGYRVYQDAVQVGMTAATAFTVAGLDQDTDYDFHVVAFDAAGNVSDPSNTVPVTTVAGDSTAPVTQLTTVPTAPDGDNGWYVSAPDVALEANEPATTYYTWGESGAFESYVETLTAPEGTNTLSYYSVDAALNTETTKTATFLVDTSAPSTPTISVGTVSTDSVELTWPAVEDSTSGVAGYRVYQGASLLETVTATAYTVSGLTPNTAYEFSVVAFDVAGNVSDPSNTVTVTTAVGDTTAPITTLLASPFAPDGDNGWYKTLPITVTLVPDETATTYYAWGIDAPIVYLAPLPVSAEGTNTLSYYSVDAALNTETTKTATFLVDTSAPATPTISVGTVSTDSVELTWPAVEDATSGVAGYRVYQGASLLETVTATAYTATGLTPNTAYEFSVVAFDVAGNPSAASNTVSVTTGAGDQSAPTTSLTADPVAPNGNDDWYVTAPTITLSADETATTSYAWGTDALATYTDPLTAPEGINTLSYLSVDADSNTETTKTATFRVDTVAPSTPALALGDVNPTSISLSWPAVTEATSGIAGYRVYQDGSLLETVTATAYAATGLDEGTEYDFRVVAFDAAGNVSADSNTVTVTTGYSDTTPPTTNASVVPSSANGDNGWYTSSPSITLSRSGDEEGITYYSWTGPGSWSEYTGSLSLTTQGESTLHFYSVDTPAGNEETAKTAAFKLDSVAPTAPTGLVAVAEGLDGAYVSWIAGTDATSGFDHYDVYVDGELAESTTLTDVNLTGLSAGVAHHVTIKTVDAAGLESVASDEVLITTLASSPADPPTLVVARAVSGSTVFLSWGTPSETMGDVIYHVWRSTGSEYQTIGLVSGIDNRSFADLQAISSTTLSYAISVEDSRGVGPMSTASVSGLDTAMLAAPAAPRGLSVSDSELGSVTLGWTPLTASNVAGYLVMRAQTSGGAVTTLTPDPVTGTTYEDLTVMPYRRYWYSVSAVDNSGAVSQPSIETRVRSEATTTAVVPHGSFTEPGSNRCGLCHVMHGADSNESLLAEETSRAICDTCHDGTGASKAITMDLADADGGSAHGLAVAGETGVTTCTDCHDPHGSGSVDELDSLLSAEGESRGNEFCYVCHGTGSTYPGGDMTAFEDSSHNTTMTSPAADLEIACLSCHETHGSADANLLATTGVGGCLGCHSEALEPSDGSDILTLLGYSAEGGSGHDLVTTETGGEPTMECKDCHGTHVVTSEAPLIDPQSSTTPWTGSTTDFCFQCHDGSDGANIKTTHATSPHASLACASCHEPHGTGNSSGLRGDVTTGTVTVSGVVVYDIPGGGQDLRFQCGVCHDIDALGPVGGSGGGPGGPGGGGHPPIETFPTDCTRSQCHSHASGRL